MNILESNMIWILCLIVSIVGIVNCIYFLIQNSTFEIDRINKYNSKICKYIENLSFMYAVKELNSKGKSAYKQNGQYRVVTYRKAAEIRMFMNTIFFDAQGYIDPNFKQYIKREYHVLKVKDVYTCLDGYYSQIFDNASNRRYKIQRVQNIKFDNINQQMDDFKARENELKIREKEIRLQERERRLSERELRLSQRKAKLEQQRLQEAQKKAEQKRQDEQQRWQEARQKAEQEQQAQQTAQRYLNSKKTMEISEFFKMKDSIKQDFEGCYVIYNETTQEYYVGQGKKVLSRANMHFTGHGNGDIYHDYKSGKHFTIQIHPLSLYPQFNLNALERNLIRIYDAYDNGYNKTRGNK